MLEVMRRGYSADAYRDLVAHVRRTIPHVAITSDFIVGFCSETEEDHVDTLSLLRHVGYDHAFLYAYSLREKTHAHRAYSDDVAHDVKQRRLRDVITVFQEEATKKAKGHVGKYMVVLVEGRSKKNKEDLCGRADNNKMVFFRAAETFDARDVSRDAEHDLSRDEHGDMTRDTSLDRATDDSTATSISATRPRGPNQGVPQKGDYVIVRVTHATSMTYVGVGVLRSTLSEAIGQLGVGGAEGLELPGGVNGHVREMLERCEEMAREAHVDGQEHADA